MAGRADCFASYLRTWLLPTIAHWRLPICSHGSLLGRHAPWVARLRHHACSTAVSNADASWSRASQGLSTVLHICTIKQCCKHRCLQQWREPACTSCHNIPCRPPVKHMQCQPDEFLKSSPMGGPCIGGRCMGMPWGGMPGAQPGGCCMPGPGMPGYAGLGGPPYGSGCGWPGGV